jgi:uncharacterized protein YkwD
MLALAAVVLHLVNAERAAHHERPLAVSPALEREAAGHRGRAHTPVRRCAGGDWGQNLAWGSFSDARPRAIVAAWMASPPHRANLLDAHYRFTGVGATREGALTVYTQDFAQHC